MKIEYINPFIESAMYVLEQLNIRDIMVEKNKLKILVEPISSLGVSALVGLTGQLKGRVIYDMDEPTALAIVSKMNSEDFKVFNEMARSTINELANMITGTAVSKLSNLGYKFDLTPPSLFSGQKIIISDGLQLKHLVVPIRCAGGLMNLNLGLTDK